MHEPGLDREARGGLLADCVVRDAQDELLLILLLFLSGFVEIRGLGNRQIINFEPVFIIDMQFYPLDKDDH